MAGFDDYIKVPENYSFTFENGIYSVLEKQFKARLDLFTSQLAALQAKENYPFLPDALVPDFPNIDFLPFKNEILERKQDIKLLKTHLPLDAMQHKSALELGGWNGWLPQLLAKYKLSTVSVGIFTDAKNGLGCRQFYPDAGWISVQADIEDTTIYNNRFDLIVFEHNLSFQNNPLELLKQYEALLNTNGFLVVLGVNVSADTQKKELEVKRYREDCFSKYGFNLDFYNSRGFFDKHFYEALLQRGYRFVSYFFTLSNWLQNRIGGNKNGIFIYQKTT